MKTKVFRKLISIILAATLLLSGVPTVFAADIDNSSVSSPHGQIAPLNPAYLNYIENGGSGEIPSSLDLSYLAESYLRQSRRRYARLPSSYDLRDYGKVSPVIDQGIYNTCWAISAMGSAESGLIEQFPNISLSVFHPAWFSAVGNDEQEFIESIGWAPYEPFFNGGNDNLAVASLAAWKGPVIPKKPLTALRRLTKASVIRRIFICRTRFIFRRVSITLTQ